MTNDLTQQRLRAAVTALQKADRCDWYVSDEEGCDGLDGCERCLEKVAQAVLTAADATLAAATSEEVIEAAVSVADAAHSAEQWCERYDEPDHRFACVPCRKMWLRAALPILRAAETQEIARLRDYEAVLSLQLDEAQAEAYTLRQQLAEARECIESLEFEVDQVRGANTGLAGGLVEVRQKVAAEAVAIVDKAFENSWVVEDALDALRALGGPQGERST